VIKTADWVIDLGPEGGDKGGYLIASGTPEQVARVAESSTGRYLRRALGMPAEPEPIAAAPRRRRREAVAAS
jgi:excinuclease ABC subunit A